MSKRRLSSEERRLWQRVTKDVNPRAKPLPAKENKDLPAPPVQEAAATSNVDLIRAAPIVIPQQKPNAPDVQSVLDAGDPRRARHVRRGRLEINAVLDLHGMTQDEAYTALQQFFMTAKASGHRIVLVITGKGRREAGCNVLSYSASTGILRKRFLQWVDGPFRSYISSVKYSHQRHGGTGAFYVFLQKSGTLQGQTSLK